MSTLCLLVVAAGTGTRMNSAIPKQYLELSGVPVITRAIRSCRSIPDIKHTAVALDEADQWWSALPESADLSVKRVAGGKSRAESVLAGLDWLELAAGPEAWVLVHDAARPLIRPQNIQSLIDTVIRTKACGGLLASRVTDTLKKVDDEQRVDTTVDRRFMWQAQTPQLFRAGSLRTAIEQGLSSGQSITDESSAMELSGEHPIVVEGSPDNIKITHAGDLAIAELLLAAQGNSGE